VLLALSSNDVILSGPLLLAVAVAATAGAISFFSPCCLPLVPGYLSYVASMAGAGSRVEAPDNGCDQRGGGGDVASRPRGATNTVPHTRGGARCS